MASGKFNIKHIFRQVANFFEIRGFKKRKIIVFRETLIYIILFSSKKKGGNL